MSYKSLSDIYNENVQYRDVASPARQQILRQIDEDVEIFVKEPIDTEPQYIGSLEDEYYRVVRRQIIAKQSGGAAEITDELLRISKWNTGLKDTSYTNQLLAPVLNILYNTTDIDIPAYTALKDNIENETWLEQALKTKKPFNMVDAARGTLSKCFSDPDALFTAMYGYSVTLNTVGVGKGELALTLFSTATKGVRGDLDVPGIGEVEVKGKAGRPGTGKAALGALKSLPAFLKERGHNIYSGSEIRAAQSKLKSKYDGNQTAIIPAIDSYIASLEGFVEENDATLDAIYGIKELVTTIYNHDPITDGALDLNSSLTEFGALYSYVEPIKGTKFTKTQYNSLSKHVQSFIALAQELSSARLRQAPETSDSWSSIVQSAFTVNWGLHINDYIEGLLHTVNEGSLDRKIINAYKKGLRSILTPDVYRSLVNGDQDNDLGMILGTIHSVSYHLVHGFPIMLMINEDSMNACPILFESDDPAELITSVYKQYKTNNFSIGASIDNQFATGVSVTYKG